MQDSSNFKFLPSSSSNNKHSRFNALTRPAAIAILACGALFAQSSDGKIWSGVYTAAQAERGKANFGTSCVRCHSADLSGATAPSLKGERFITAWENESLYRLFTKIRDTMPPNFGTALTDQDKLDVVAYILQVNNFPAGADELQMTAEELEGIQIVRKGQGTDIPNFSLVRVVGCLEPGGNHTWLLTRTTAAAATREPSSTSEGLQAAAALPLGSDTLRLVNVTPFKPDLHRGRKMEAKGLLYREPGESRLNLTSLVATTETCPASPD